MEERNDLWTQLFKDQPVPEGMLLNLQTRIMNQVRAEPVDFQQEIVIARRRRWGLLLVGSLLVIGAVFFMLIWWQGNVMEEAVKDSIWRIAGLVPDFGFKNLWQVIWPKIVMLDQLQLGIAYIWQEYASPFLGLTTLIVLSGFNMTSLKRGLRILE